ncbi:transcription termination factor Rho [Gordonia insulae]|uniref:Transcription termination factor Rho n=1 Tax=Gordonia insulae TaxID=2420509 RepID=A0A3G8JID2_9ACTN|nr:transcription termination factor Rho [Gordonia insulae]AZG44763.1 Transcription termination factor Rho [Gordonia insulae]
MTDTDLISAPATTEAPAGGRSTRARTGLAGMVLTELRALAGELGIKGTSGMRKGDLIAAIKERQESTSGAAKKTDTNGQMSITDGDGSTETADAAPPARRRRATRAESTEAPTTAASTTEASTTTAPTTESPAEAASADTGSSSATGTAESQTTTKDSPAKDAPAESTDGGEQRGRNRNRNQNRDGGQGRDNQGRDGGQGRDNQGRDNQGRDGGQGRDNQNRDNQNRDNQGRDNQGGQNRDNQNRRDNQNNQGGGQNNRNNRDNRDDDDDDGSGRGRRGRRFRERRRGRDRESTGQNEPQVSDDDVVQPVAGILDVLDNYAFVRTSGYLAGPNDVYVSMNMVRKNGLRRGDAITGAVKVPREGEQPNQRQKFNPLVRLDTVNGTDIETAKRRPEFSKLTPLYPNQRLRLETTPERLDTRVIDLIMPIGKGQRALIVSPPKAGKTTILQDIANAIATNNPECHLMVVLVDERPEEVTDMQRSVKGEVIASTFDRPPSDHTSVSELAIERAKRLVENGKDVVVLLDSITRLGRAYNNASPASGRILSGGVDSTALYPPKRFLGAARNIEHGGSLTIIASALVETGSTGDTVIFEEFKGTGNAELKLDRKISERRVFPAVDVNLSSTRKDELLLSPEEFQIVHKLRRVLSGLDSQQAIDLLISQLKKTKTNIEFLMQVQKTAPGAMRDD